MRVASGLYVCLCAYARASMVQRGSRCAVRAADPAFCTLWHIQRRPQSGHIGAERAGLGLEAETRVWRFFFDEGVLNPPWLAPGDVDAGVRGVWCDLLRTMLGPLAPLLRRRRSPAQPQIDGKKIQDPKQRRLRVSRLARNAPCESRGQTRHIGPALYNFVGGDIQRIYSVRPRAAP